MRKDVQTRRTIAYVLPIYNEAGSIDLLARTLDEVTAPLAGRYAFRFVFVDDGSRDDSLRLLHELAERDDRVTVLELSRNFGHQIAVTAGLDAVDADAVVIMDSDLQDPPRVSVELIERWEDGYDVVYARRRSRQDGAFKRHTARGFYRLLNRVANIDIPADTGDFRLLDRAVVEQLRRFGEHNRFLRGMVSYVGFRQTSVPFDRDARHAGVTGYPLRAMLKFAADGILGFSVAPLRLISKIGYLISLLSVVGILYVLGVRLFASETAVPGWAFITVAIFFLGGVQITMLGVVGSYVGRIYTESQRRPLYIVASVRSGKPVPRIEPAERAERAERAAERTQLAGQDGAAEPGFEDRFAG